MRLKRTHIPDHVAFTGNIPAFDCIIATQR